MVFSLRDKGGEPLWAPHQTFDALEDIVSAEWGRGHTADTHIARAVGKLRWRVMERQMVVQVNLQHVLVARDSLEGSAFREELG